MSTENAAREPDSQVERCSSLQLSLSGSGHLDLGDREGQGTRAKVRQESRKNIWRKGALEQSLHCDLQSVVSSVFLSHPTLELPWGEVNRTRSMMVRNGFREDSWTPAHRRCPPGAYSFHSATS